jgi:hypothetical protein
MKRNVDNVLAISFMHPLRSLAYVVTAVLCIIYLEENLLLLVGGNQIAQWGQDAF